MGAETSIEESSIEKSFGVGQSGSILKCLTLTLTQNFVDRKPKNDSPHKSHFDLGNESETWTRNSSAAYKEARVIPLDRNKS